MTVSNSFSIVVYFTVVFVSTALIVAVVLKMSLAITLPTPHGY